MLFHPLFGINVLFLHRIQASYNYMILNFQSPHIITSWGNIIKNCNILNIDQVYSLTGRNKQIDRPVSHRAVKLRSIYFAFGTWRGLLHTVV